MANRNIKAVPNEKTEVPEENGTPPTIAKPSDEFDLSRFKSKKSATISNVETLPMSLPVMRISDAGDHVRLHSDETNYWSDELCFISVPVKGSKQNTLHLIDEDLALQFLQNKEILRFRLALATKPNDVFFLCQIPTRNVDNSWNESNLEACEKAKTLWTKAVSRRDEGIESYQINFARDADAFPKPNWPTQSLGEMIMRAFPGRRITTEDHPALLRKIGAKQKLS